jgi:hypothetical protein
MPNFWVDKASLVAAASNTFRASIRTDHFRLILAKVKEVPSRPKQISLAINIKKLCSINHLHPHCHKTSTIIHKIWDCWNVNIISLHSTMAMNCTVHWDIYHWRWQDNATKLVWLELRHPILIVTCHFTSWNFSRVWLKTCKVIGCSNCEGHLDILMSKEPENIQVLKLRLQENSSFG